MKRMCMSSVLFLGCLAAASGGAGRVQADPIMYVYASSAPNVFGSPSWVQWQNNALTALQQLSGVVGNPATDPAAFQHVQIMGDMDNIVSGFASWKGQLNPGTNFGSAFANELGNRLMFPVRIIGNGQKIKLENIDYQMDSNPTPIFDFTGGFATATYQGPGVGVTIARVGVIYNVSGPPTYIMSGEPGTTLVDEILITGIGNAVDANDTPPFSGTPQNRLDQAKLFYDLRMPFCVEATYFYLNDAFTQVLTQFTQGVDFGPDPICAVPVPVPEPGALALLSAGVMGITLRRWRRTRPRQATAAPT